MCTVVLSKARKLIPAASLLTADELAVCRALRLEPAFSHASPVSPGEGGVVYEARKEGGGGGVLRVKTRDGEDREICILRPHTRGA